MALIARSQDLLNAQEIADRTGFSKNHIAKILQQLVKYNYLSSTRGPKGGFLLKKQAHEVTLMDIYKAIEGEIETSHCQSNCDACPFRSCIFGGLNSKFSREFISYLNKKNLSEL